MVPPVDQISTDAGHTATLKPSHADHVLQLNVEELSTAKHTIISSTAQQWTDITSINRIVDLSL